MKVTLLSLWVIQLIDRYRDDMTENKQKSFTDQLEPNSYYDNRFDCQAVKILPGEYFATRNDVVIVTVLGSCVSVCLRDAFAGIGGMNHFLLPSDQGSSSQNLTGSARYGRYAIDILIEEMVKLGAVPSRIQAKVFGGGNVLKGLAINNIGEMNASFVLDYLSHMGIPVAARDLLDVYPRKVYFFPQTGEVLVKKIKHLNNTTIMERESAYRLKLRDQPEWE